MSIQTPAVEDVRFSFVSSYMLYSDRCNTPLAKEINDVVLALNDLEAKVRRKVYDDLVSRQPHTVFEEALAEVARLRELKLDLLKELYNQAILKDYLSRFAYPVGDEGDIQIKKIDLLA